MSTVTNKPRMHERYEKEIAPELEKEFKYTNKFSIPKLQKIVLNIGCGEAAKDAKVLETAQKTLEIVTGQKPAITRAKKAISNFKLRKNDPVGCMVTLRRKRMYEFLDRLISVALPRIRDFRGYSPKGFDTQGNYNFGIQEQIIFPEIDIDKFHNTLGMNVVFVTTAKNADEGKALLKGFGFPFTRERQQQ